MKKAIAIQTNMFLYGNDLSAAIFVKRGQRWEIWILSGDKVVLHRHNVTIAIPREKFKKGFGILEVTAK